MYTVTNMRLPRVAELQSCVLLVQPLGRLIVLCLQEHLSHPSQELVHPVCSVIRTGLVNIIH